MYSMIYLNCLNNNDHMRIEVRFAQTGHSHQFNHINNVKDLMNVIKNDFKVQYNDQTFISKSGCLMRETDNLQSLTGLMQMTYVSDANQNTHMNVTPMLFLFDNKMLLANNDQKQQPSKSQCLNILKISCTKLSQLKNNIYELKPLSSTEYGLLNSEYPEIATYYKTIYQQYSAIDILVSEFVSIKREVDSVTQKCDNQRKSVKALDRYLQNIVDLGIKRKVSQVEVKLQETFKLFQQDLEIDYCRNSLLKEGEQKKKKIYNFIASCKNKLKSENEFKLQISGKMKEDKKLFKDKFKNLDHILKQVDEKSNNMEKQLKIIMQKIKEKYTNFYDAARLLGKGKSKQTQILEIINPKSQIQEANRQKFIIKQYIEDQKSNFCQLYLQNTKIENQIRIIYANFCQIHTRTINHQKQFKKIQRQVSQLIKLIEHFKSVEYRETIFQVEQQIKRRMLFNKNLSQISHQIQTIIIQQSQKRKQYLLNNTFKKIYQNQLNNISVPYFKLSFQATSDQLLSQLLVKNYDQLLFQNSENLQNLKQPQSLTFNERQIMKSLQMVNIKVKQLNCQKNQKMKNMQCILEHCSQIYYDIYLKKIQEQNVKMKEYEEANRQKSKQIRILSGQLQKVKQQIKVLYKKEELKRQNDEQMIALQALNQRLSKKNLELEEKISEMLRKIEKQKESKGSYHKQKVLLIQNLQKQLDMNQHLSNQIENLQQQRDYYCNEFNEIKILLGDKQSLIVTLQHQLICLKSSIPMNSMANNGQESSELRAQIKYLEQKNDQLQDQINKIIYRQTDDQQIQTQTLENLTNNQIRQFSHGKISLFHITEGQQCIFAPFGQSTYVGICLADIQNTNCISNTNIAQRANHKYILDLNFLPSKSRSFLSQCNMIVVLKVLRVRKDEEVSWVEGQIDYVLGFEDDEKQLKNYSHML